MCNWLFQMRVYGHPECKVLAQRLSCRSRAVQKQILGRSQKTLRSKPTSDSLDEVSWCWEETIWPMEHTLALITGMRRSWCTFLRRLKQMRLGDALMPIPLCHLHHYPMSNTMKNEMQMEFINSQVVQQFLPINSGKTFTGCIQTYPEGKRLRIKCADTKSWSFLFSVFV